MLSKLDPNKCQRWIYRERGLMNNQCEKKVKVEVDGKKYCAIHSPQAQELKEKKYWEKIKKREKFEEKIRLENAIELLKSKGYKINLK